MPKTQSHNYNDNKLQRITQILDKIKMHKREKREVAKISNNVFFWISSAAYFTNIILNTFSQHIQLPNKLNDSNDELYSNIDVTGRRPTWSV